MVANDSTLSVLLRVRQVPGQGRSALIEVSAELANRGDEPIDMDGDRSVFLVGHYAMRDCPRVSGNVTYTADRDESESVKILIFGRGVRRIMPGMTDRHEESFSVNTRRRLHVAAIVLESPPGDRVWVDWRPVLTGWDEKVGNWWPGKQVVMPADADRRVRRPPGNVRTKK